MLANKLLFRTQKDSFEFAIELALGPSPLSMHSTRCCDLISPRVFADVVRSQRGRRGLPGSTVFLALGVSKLVVQPNTRTYC